MLTVAYLANQFPSPVEPYVGEEILELRRRGVNVVAGSVRLGNGGECEPDLLLLPVSLVLALRAVWLGFRRWKRISPLMRRIFVGGSEGPISRLKALVHTWLGACYAIRLKNLRIDHIHVHHGFFGAWIGMAAARLLGIDFSLTLHGSDLLLYPSYLDVKLEFCCSCFTISEYNRNYILQRYPLIDPSKVIVARLGVEVPDAPPRELEARQKAPFMLLAVGRLHAVKDHAFLLRACTRLQSCGVDFHCVIAGDGPERRNLENFISRHALTSHVTLLGHVPRDEMSGWYGVADLVVLTSRSEGIPLVLMEAMARGKLVLAPAITGIPELVIAGQTGFLYQPGSLGDFVTQLMEIYRMVQAAGAETPDSQSQNASAGQLEWIRHAAWLRVRQKFERQKNLDYFAERFLSQVSEHNESIPHEDFVLQQI